MSHDTGRTCKCVTEHRPHPLELNLHHVLPLYLGGPDVDTNKVWLCPSAHVSVHELLRLMMRVGPLTWGEVGLVYDERVSRYAYHLAAEGYSRFQSSRVTL